MREYEMMVIYDLAMAEANGVDAAPGHLTTVVESYGGSMVVVDHWGRRRMAYRINNHLDADYVVARVEMDPEAIARVQADLRITESVLRWQVVRADELPPFVPATTRARAAQQAAAQAEAAAAPAEAAPTAPAEEGAAPEAAAPQAAAPEAPAETPVTEESEPSQPTEE